MENASKALLMAGAVLIALLIIAVLLYTFGNMSEYFNTEDNLEKTEQLTAFNKQYEAYNRKLLRGTDVISVINKAIDNNKKYGSSGSNELDFLVNIEFEMKESLVYTKEGTSSNVSFKVGQKYNIASFSSIKQNKEAFDDFKRRIFDCQQVDYHKTTGRVNYIYFIERKMEQKEYEEGLIY